MVRALLDIIEREIGFAFTHRIAVEQDLVFGFGVVDIRRRFPCDDWVFTASSVFCQIGVGTVNGGQGAVILFDPAAHFLEQLFFQAFQRLFELGLGVGVLSFEIFANIGAQNARVLHDLLPIFVFHPIVRIDPRAADLFNFLHFALGDRRGERHRCVLSFSGWGRGIHDYRLGFNR